MILNFVILKKEIRPHSRKVLKYSFAQNFESTKLGNCKKPKISSRKYNFVKEIMAGWWIKISEYFKTRIDSRKEFRPEFD